MTSVTIDFHQYAVSNTVIHNTRESIPYIMESFSLDPEVVYLQMEEIKQDIKDTTSDYCINTPTPNINILVTADETIKYTKALLQPHHSYPEPPTTPISHFSPPTTPKHLTTDLSAEAHTSTAATDTASVPNVISLAIMYTLSPEKPLSDSTEEPSNFLFKHTPDNPKE